MSANQKTNDWDSLTNDDSIYGLFEDDDNNHQKSLFTNHSAAAAAAYASAHDNSHDWASLGGDDYTASQGDGTVIAFGYPSAGEIAQSWTYNQSNVGNINVQGAWANYQGAGIKVAVIDEGIQYSLAELSPNYNTALDWDSGDNDDTPLPDTSSNDHGTGAASIIAAQDNNGGMVGIAPDATLAAIKLNFTGSAHPSGQTEIADALWRAASFDVASNSWGGNKFGYNFLLPSFYQVQDALIHGVQTGRGGLGTNYVFAAGNSRVAIGGIDQSGDDSNFSNLPNNAYVIAVGAHNDTGVGTFLSSRGANVLVTAPGNSTTALDNSGNLVPYSGTSSAAPHVSGIITLMLQANPNLGYRDVQTILAMTAKKNPTGPNDIDPWAYNHADNWNNGGMHFSNDAGYGMVDATAAVRLAETWNAGQHTYANLSTAMVEGSNATFGLTSSTVYSQSITVSSNLVLEHVDLRLHLIDPNLEYIDVILVSPEGTRSNIIENMRLWDTQVDTDVDFTYGSREFLGELSAGTWTLEVRTSVASTTVDLTDFDLKIYGSIPPTNDVYYYTSEYGGTGRYTLTDTDGGIDTINASAINDYFTAIDLAATSGNHLGAYTFNIAPGTIIENVYTGDGNDNIKGNNGVANILAGGRGDDIYYVDYQDTVIEKAGQGQDTIYARSDYILAAGASIEHLRTATSTLPINLTGNELDNEIVGNSMNNILNGGLGYDQIYASDGNDTLYDGEYAYSSTYNILEGSYGNDTYIIYGSNTIAYDDPGAGSDIIYTYGSFTLSAGSEIEHIRTHNDAGTTALNIYGNEFAQIIVGNYGVNVLKGYAGNDTLYGLEGNDTLYGQGDNDVLYGGNGDDTLYGGDGNDQLRGEGGNDAMYGNLGDDDYFVDSIWDTVFENTGEGTDTIWASVNYSISNTSYVETIRTGSISSTYAVNLTGNSSNNNVYGNAGNNVLKGHGGDDNIKTFGGTDTMIGGNGADKFYFNVLDGQVSTVTDFTYSGTDHDIIDVGGILEGATQAAINNFVKFSTSGATTTMKINANGAGSDWVTVGYFTDTTIAGKTAAQLASTGHLDWN